MSQAAVKYDEVDVEIRVGLDEPALRAIFYLWRMVSAEKGKPYDEMRLAEYLYARIHGARLLPIVAWDGPEPVGFCCAMIDVDPFTGERILFGDHAFVQREWRGAGVFSALVDAGVAVAELCGCDGVIAPVSNESSYLLRHYESVGFEKVAHIIKRKLT